MQSTQNNRGAMPVQSRAQRYTGARCSQDTLYLHVQMLVTACVLGMLVIGNLARADDDTEGVDVTCSNHRNTGDVKAENQKSTTPSERALFAGVERGDADQVDALLLGVQSMNFMHEDTIVLTAAVASAHPHIVTALRRAGANIRAEACFQLTAIDALDKGSALATDTQVTTIADQVEKAGAPINQRSNASILMHASFRGHTTLMAGALDNGARVNEIAVGGVSALLVAAENNQIGSVILLLLRGANPKLTGSPTSMPLVVAVQDGAVTFVELRLTHSTDPNKTTLNGTPLHIARFRAGKQRELAK